MVSYLAFVSLLLIVALLIYYRNWATAIGRIELVVTGVLCFIVLILVTRGTPLGDFIKGYHSAGRMIWENPQDLYQCEVSNACFVNLPILAIFLTPFSYMPERIGGAAFTIVGVVLATFAAWQLSRRVEGVQGRIVMALFMLSGPLAYSVRLGNLTHMLLPLMCGAFDAQSRGRQKVAGLMLAMAALVKPFLALFLIYFLMRRQWAAFFAMGAAAAVAVLVSLAMFGVNLHLIFLNEIVFGFGSKPIVAYNVQNFAGFIGHLTMPGRLEDWIPIDEPAWFKTTRLLLAGAAVLSVVSVLKIAGIPRTSTAWRAELCIILCLALLTAPVTWTHYLCLLLIPMSFLVANRANVCPPDRKWNLWLGLLMLLLSLPSQIPSVGGRLEFLVHRVWVSHYFIGALMLLAVLLSVRVRMPIISPMSPATADAEEARSGEL